MPRLEKIEALAFHDLHSLATMECRNNHKLSYIHSKAFRDNLYQERQGTVSVLDLSGNNLTSLSEDLLTWSILQSIHLEGNTWSCDIGSVDHFGYLWPQKMPEVSSLWLQK